MVYAVLTNKLQWAIGWVSLENSYNAFGERDSQSVFETILKLYLITGFEVVLRVSSWTNRNKIVLPYINAIYFRNKLNLLLWVIIQRHSFTQSVHMVVRKWFLRKGWCRVSHHISTCEFKHSDWTARDSIDITSNKFKLSIVVSLSTSVINWNPSSNISLGLVVIQCYWVIWLPWKTSSSICNLAISGDGLVAEDLPAESGDSKESIRQRREMYSFDIVQHLYSTVSFKNVSISKTKQSSIQFKAFLS